MKNALAQQIRESVRPAVEAFADQLVELLAAQAYDALQDAVATARSILVDALQPVLPMPAITKAPPAVRRKRPKRDTQPKPPVERPATKRATRPRRTKPVPVPVALDDDSGTLADVSAPAVSRDRFAEIQARAQARQGASR